MTKRTAAILATFVSVTLFAGILALAAWQPSSLILLVPWLASVIVAVVSVDEYLEADDQGEAKNWALVALLVVIAIATMLVLSTEDASANHEDPVCHDGTTLWLEPDDLAVHLGHGDPYGTCEGDDPNYDLPTTTTTEPPAPPVPPQPPAAPPASDLPCSPPADPVVATPSVTG